MSKRTKMIARLGVMTALGVVLLLLTNILPAGRLGLMLIASFPVCAALMMYGRKWAAGVFAVTAGLGFLLFPGTTAVGYALFFGYYPILKSLIERVHGRLRPWLLKLAAYTAAFIGYWFLARALFSGAEELYPAYVLYVLGAAAFIVYDFCYTLAIRFYLERIARYFAS